MTDTQRVDALLAMGEVHTGLLRTSAAMPVVACERLVAGVDGGRGLRYERPIAHVVSPPQLTGVDCRPPTATGVKARVIGAVSGHVSVTGGHIVQGAAQTEVVMTRQTRRLGWSHYLARPGRVELIGTVGPDDIALGFLAPDPHPSALDLGAIAARLVNGVQASSALDQRAPLRIERTRFRWVALADGDDRMPTLRFRVERNGLRTLLVQGGGYDFASIAEFTADVALHDWLLTALLRVIERSRMGIDAKPVVIGQLRPAVEHLMHLWMPAARTQESTVELWNSLERRPGLSRQWKASVDRIRDQLAMSTIGLLSDRLGETVR
jgi:hypothetical protein